MNLTRRAERRARAMVQTGRYRSWQTIALHLDAEGFGDARDMLDDPLLIQELDGYCRTANDRG